MFAGNGTPGLLPSVVSPLLTPQFVPKGSISFPAYTCITPNTTKSQQIRILSYESPMLSCTTYREGCASDLDSNKLDLNKLDLNYSVNGGVSSFGIKYNNNSSNSNRNSDGLTTTNTSSISNVSNILDSCASENYKKWLSSH
ncbi:hypothetical protein FOA43_000242 [Brettanomyces nanus]|uniref:Uncharacterized protein n=1 Tax=Eeniella nana TaxID=13502 RepID=A0A875RWQ0_EENNA|nr:uncharacterized protein FOA43_000242 [Brettanomyces nanus]QPG72938.1 hypothetical protein FOA43_000242 [Brettanomyces nanus]